MARNTSRCWFGTIIESEGNRNALIEPVIRAVSSCIIFHRDWVAKGLAWIAAFDAIPLLHIVDTMKGLDLLEETMWRIDVDLFGNDPEQQTAQGI
jgi:hypothetical protein